MFPHVYTEGAAAFRERPGERMRAGSEVLSHGSRGPAPSRRGRRASVSEAEPRGCAEGTRRETARAPGIPLAAAPSGLPSGRDGNVPPESPRGHRGADSEPAAGSAAQPRGAQPAPRPQDGSRQAKHRTHTERSLPRHYKVQTVIKL